MTHSDPVSLLFTRLRERNITAKEMFGCCDECSSSAIHREQKPDDKGFCYYHRKDAQTAAKEGFLRVCYGSWPNSSKINVIPHLIRSVLKTECPSLSIDNLDAGSLRINGIDKDYFEEKLKHLSKMEHQYDQSVSKLIKALSRKNIISKENFTCCQECACQQIRKEKKRTHIGYCFYTYPDSLHAFKTGVLRLSYGSVNSDSPKKCKAVGRLIVKTVHTVCPQLEVDWNGDLGRRIELAGVDPKYFEHFIDEKI
ncbi:hypothetical protein GEMRC1_001502 [Eukaryota sp. GEM-RC1]